jgi:hypothetical protein
MSRSGKGLSTWCIECRDNRYRIYVLELKRRCQKNGTRSDCLYVGSTGLAREHRRSKHIGRGRSAAAQTKKYGVGQLRFDLFDPDESFDRREEAEGREMEVAAQMAADGYCVHGGGPGKHFSGPRADP